MVMKKIKERIENTEKNRLVSFSLASGIMFGIILGYIAVAYLISNSINLPFMQLSDPSTGVDFSTANLTSKVESYLNANFLNPYGATASITNVTKLQDVTVIQMDIMQDGTAVSAGEVYATNDGEMIIVGAIYNMSQNLEIPADTGTAAADIPKSEMPNVKLFVMSYCPYGQQAEEAMWPVTDLLGDEMDFELHYVVYPAEYYAGQESTYCINGTYCSMHGVAELNENLRQMCIINSYNYSVWKDYIQTVSTSCNYQNVDTCWEGIAAAKGIDVDAVKSCFDQNALTYAEQEYQLNLQYGVQGSPMLFINDVEYAGSRTAEGYKQSICSGYNSEPSSCSTTLDNSGGTATGSC